MNDATVGCGVRLIRWRNQFNPGPFRHVGNEDTTPPDTRIFSPLAVARLCVTIGRHWYLFKRLTAVSAGRFYRFEHIVTDSSFCPGSGTKQAQPAVRRYVYI